MGTIKRTVKAYLDNNIGKTNISYETIKDKVDYVSFDIFDTLIKRDVNKPTDVFLLLEKQFRLPGFCSKRIEAEQKARCNKIGGEVTLEEIYQSYDGISAAEAKEYCRREIETELQVCHRNNQLYPFYLECVKNKKIVLISDMYLTSDIVEKILNKCGIDEYEKLYISCEVGVSKHNSELYRYVLNDLGIKANRMLHVGNDFMSDNFKPERVGVESFKLKTKTDNLLVGSAPRKLAEKSGQFSLIYNFINNTTCSSKDFEDFYYRFGYENFGILLMGFCKWLIKEAENAGIEQLLFIARDGYILKKAYDLMGFSKRIPSGYLELSRRSIRVPSSFSVPQTYEDCILLLNSTRRISIGQILDTWGLDVESCSKQLEVAGIKADEVFWKERLQDNAALTKLYNLVKGDMLSNGLAEKDALTSYLGKFDFERKTGLVDIGYGGTIQKELLKEFSRHCEKVELQGFYMVFDQKRLRENTDGQDIRVSAYTKVDEREKKNDLDIYQYVGLFETMFLEQTGSIKRFSVCNGEVSIERYEYEYDTPGGEIDETTNVVRIQQGALDFISAAVESCVGKLKTIDNLNAFYFLDRAFSYPTKNILMHFYNYRFFNMGKAFLLAKPQMSIIEYCLHIKELKTDFFESMWKTGFLRNLLGFNIPYKEIKSLCKSISK